MRRVAALLTRVGPARAQGIQLFKDFNMALPPLAPLRRRN